MKDQAADTRYGHRARSGANEPKRNEKKEQRPDWQPHQGGDQSRPGEQRPNEDRLSDDARSQGKATRGQDVVATRRHLEGAEQGSM
jgi:hypothetical protein